MKKQNVVTNSFTWTMLSSLLLASSLVQAEEKDTFSKSWYLNANIGLAQGDDSASKLNGQLSGAGLNAKADTDSTRRTSFLFGGGYHFTDALAAEVAYVNLGKVETTFTGASADAETFLKSAKDIHPQTAWGVRMTGVYRLSVADVMEVSLRAGAFSWQSEYTLKAGGTSRNINESGTSLTYGLGAETAVFSPNYRIGLYYDKYDIEGEGIDVLSAGVTYLFD